MLLQMLLAAQSLPLQQLEHASTNAGTIASSAAGTILLQQLEYCSIHRSLNLASTADGILLLPLLESYLCLLQQLESLQHKV